MKKNHLFVCTMSLIIVSAFLAGCNKNEDYSDISVVSESDSAAIDADEISLKSTDEDTDSQTTTESEESESIQKTEKRNVVNPVKVNVKSSSGSSVDMYEAISDIDLNRPASILPNQVFTGWEETEIIQQIEKKTVDIADIIDITAESKDISEESNVIYNDAIYVDNDIPVKFSVPIIVGGTTDFCIIEAEISYDSKLLEFIELQNPDPDLTYNCNKEEGKIFLSFLSNGNINAELDLCEIVFETKGKEPAETSLEYIVNDIASWNESASDFDEVKYKIINSKIVMY